MMEAKNEYLANINQKEDFDENKYFTTFVEKNTMPYRKKFNRVEQGRMSWNWCAFLFTAFWFAYRRMFKEAVLLVLLMTVLGSVLSSLMADGLTVGGLILSGLCVVIEILTGLFADRIYYSKYRYGLEEEEPLEYAEDNGGTSAVKIILLVGISVVISTVATFLAALIGMAIS